MDFDCFLSYNSKDQLHARALYERLRKAGLAVWFDQEQIRPGDNEVASLDDGLARSAAGVVLIGGVGFGPWQDQEAQSLLSRAVREHRLLIPVLLPGVPVDAQLPSLLGNYHRVNLCGGLADDEFLGLVRVLVDLRRGNAGTVVRPPDQPAARPAGPQPEVPCLSVFLASSGDAADERGQARDLIEQLPRLPGLPARFGVEVSAWDQPAGAPMTPDEAGTAGLARPGECRIAVFILGWTLGPPPGPAWPVSPVGPPWRCVIDWQYRDAQAAAALTGSPAILVYRKGGGPALRPDAPDFDETLAQWRAVRSFCDDLGHPAGGAPPAVKDYDSPSDLVKQLTADLKDLAKRLLPGAARPAVGAAPAATARLWVGCPYPGLDALRLRDATIFRGRGPETDALLRQLAEPSRPCLTVVGASGSGKSSLVWAGLLPRLTAAKGWRYVRFTPMEGSGDPLAALAAAMAHAFEHCRWEAGALAVRLATPAGLRQAAERVLDGAPPGAELALFVDQLEELFRVPGAAAKARFIDCLAAAAALPRVRILATLRADFVPELPTEPRLAALYNQGNFLLTAPLRPARMRMVIEPAQRAGLDLEPGLAKLIVRETGDRPGALPLMAYALERLYERDRDQPVLTQRSYLECGGVLGAIATQADRVFADFAEVHGMARAEAARRCLFSELVQVEGADAPVTRCRAALTRLGPDTGPVADLAGRLVTARLLVTDHEAPAGGGPAAGPVVDVAHEALLTHWTELALWIDTRRDDLRLRDLLRRSVTEWEANGYRNKFLLRTDRVADVRAALERLGGQDLSAAECAFLDPVRRAGWLLARDAHTWVGTGRGAAELWDAERIEGFATLPPGHLPEPTPEQRAFLADSFAAALRRHAAEPLVRAACGQALGALGDPRFDPGAWHLPADPTLGFREVPGGPFRMGTDPEHEPKGWSDEEPQHDQDLPTLYVARWPVTVAQFAAFVAAGGHRPADADACKGHPNHPVVLVTWHDARAYCAWHGERMQAIAAERLAAPAPAAPPVGAGGGRDAAPVAEPQPQAAARRFWEGVAAGRLQPGLPSEPEWEKAARGTDGRIYAGGNTLTPDLANYKDTGLKATCAVGCFPDGAGPYGCEDQTGNVWEWTRSLWGPDWQRVGFKYPYKAQDGREDSKAGDDLARVLRGGAFSNDSDNCRSAVRNRYDPHFRDVNCGFRVVWSPLLCTLSPLDSEPLNL